MLSLQLTNIDKGNYDVRIISSDGRNIQSQKLEHTGGNTVYSLPINATIAKGNCHLLLISGNKTLSSQTIIIE